MKTETHPVSLGIFLMPYGLHDMQNLREPRIAKVRDALTGRKARNERKTCDVTKAWRARRRASRPGRELAAKSRRRHFVLWLWVVCAFDRGVRERESGRKSGIRGQGLRYER